MSKRLVGYLGLHDQDHQNHQGAWSRNLLLEGPIIKYIKPKKISGESIVTNIKTNIYYTKYNNKKYNKKKGG